MSTNLHPTMAAFLAPFAPPNSVVHTIADEAAAVKADRAIQAMKDSGELHRRETHRAHIAEINHGDHE